MYSYCLYCQNKNEELLAEKIGRAYGVETIFPLREKLIWLNGESTTNYIPLTPGYIFLYSSQPVSSDKLEFIKRYDTILEYGDGTSELSGGDKTYADWIYRYRGLMKASDAVRNTTMKKLDFVNGPLREVPSISSVDARKRLAFFRWPFMGKPRRLALSFRFA